MELVKINDHLWEIPRTGAMLVPGRVYANARMIAELRDDPALGQVANVACLPGIVGYSLAMPDIHWGYGFPIGGVAAVDADVGVILAGGVGYDINCGVRLVRTNLEEHIVDGHKRRLCVHRKGATRAFARGNSALPEALRPLGQPVLIPGDVSRYSFVLLMAARYSATYRARSSLGCVRDSQSARASSVPSGTPRLGFG